MDKGNEQSAIKLLENYLLSNKKVLPLDPKIKEILHTEINEHTYYLYEPVEIQKLLEENGRSIEELHPELRKLLQENLKGNYVPSGWINDTYWILIRKKVSQKFVECEFIHEYCHYQYGEGKWKERKPPNKEVEELECNKLCCLYASHKKFLGEYMEFCTIRKKGN